MVGLAIPADPRTPQWTHAVHTASGLGMVVIPVYFIAPGVTVFPADHGGVPWSVAVVATGVAILGTYVGARLDGHPPGVALRLGALLNTRGAPSSSYSRPDTARAF